MKFNKLKFMVFSIGKACSVTTEYLFNILEPVEQKSMKDKVGRSVLGENWGTLIVQRSISIKLQYSWIRLFPREKTSMGRQKSVMKTVHVGRY